MSGIEGVLRSGLCGECGLARGARETHDEGEEAAAFDAVVCWGIEEGLGQAFKGEKAQFGGGKFGGLG